MFKAIAVSPKVTQDRIEQSSGIFGTVGHNQFQNLLSRKIDVNPWSWTVMLWLDRSRVASIWGVAVSEWVSV